jgi:hypothetical protein
LAPVAALIEAAGHKVFTPTIKGIVEDAKTVGIERVRTRRGWRTP